MKVTVSLFLLAMLLVAVFADSNSSEEKRPLKKGKNKKKYHGVKNVYNMRPHNFDSENDGENHRQQFRPGRPPIQPGGPRGPHRRPPYRRPRPQRPIRPDFFPIEEQRPMDFDELDNFPFDNNEAVLDGGRQIFSGFTKPTLVLIKPGEQMVPITQDLCIQPQQQQQKPNVIPDSNAEVSEINKIPESGHVDGINADINLTGQSGVKTETTSTGETNTQI